MIGILFLISRSLERDSVHPIRKREFLGLATVTDAVPRYKMAGKWFALPKLFTASKNEGYEVVRSDDEVIQFKNEQVYTLLIKSMFSPTFYFEYEPIQSTQNSNTIFSPGHSKSFPKPRPSTLSSHCHWTPRRSTATSSGQNTTKIKPMTKTIPTKALASLSRNDRLIMWLNTWIAQKSRPSRQIRGQERRQ